MTPIDLEGRVVLITGGTQGIGRATAMEFALAGAQVYATCKWGSADLEDLYREFDTAGAVKPVVIEADVSLDDDTDLLLSQIEKQESRVDVFVSNVGFAPVVNTLADYKKRSFFKTLEYSSWPVIEYTRKIHKVFGAYPKNIVGISSDGPDHYYRGYDYVSAAKALLEHFVRYLAVHVLPSGCRANVLRFGTVKTASFDAIFGDEFFEFARSEGLPEHSILEPSECGRAVLALCSGLMDAVNGQIITVDYGLPFQDNLMMRFLKSKDESAS